MKKIIIAGLIGGIASFLAAFALQTSGLHNIKISRFKDEKAVEKVLADNAPLPGFYFLPYPDTKGLSGEEATRATEDAMEQMANGMFVTGAVRPAGGKPMTESIILQFITCCLCSIALAALLCAMGKKSFGRRVGFTLTLALFGFAAFLLPFWTWYGYPGTFILVGLVDTVILWGVTGSVIALLFRRFEGG
ncbi:MAG: hypothetical protein VCD16_15540 [Planctomycetota bacterium]